jgi:uncharacterized protein YqjF (DUF2071 family)
MNPLDLAILAALAANHGSLSTRELLAVLTASTGKEHERSCFLSLLERSWVEGDERLTLTKEGIRALLEMQVELEAALDLNQDPSPRYAVQEDCPSIPWLTTVQTCWIDAVSINYAVDPDALRSILPPPLEPEIWKGSAWVQLLMSSLRDMRPQGLMPLFGVCFYQASYRAAIRYRSVDGSERRGGYFVRSETNHPVMRAVGNALAEFRFHDFGAAEMVMVRDGDRLTLGIDAERPHGKVVALLDTRPSLDPPPKSVWSSLAELEEPLVECYDALGVDSPYLYLLTIDRDPWNARFVTPLDLYVEYFENGPLGGGASRYDSTLHFRECGYRWRPLRREPLR